MNTNSMMISHLSCADV